VRSKLINTNIKGFKKDTDTGIILNANYSDLETYYKQKELIKQARKHNEYRETTDKKLLELKNEVAELKDLLKQILESKL